MQTFQSEIFSGLDDVFVGKLMGVGETVSYEQGTILFSEGDPARNFFLLQKGRVRLSMGGQPNAVYTISQRGEVFGWSSLTSRDCYSSTGLCVAPSTLTVIDRAVAETVLAEDAVNAVRFYKNLAQCLGNCLIMARAQLAERLYVDDKDEFCIEKVQGMLTFV